MLSSWILGGARAPGEPGGGPRLRPPVRAARPRRPHSPRARRRTTPRKQIRTSNFVNFNTNLFRTYKVSKKWHRILNSKVTCQVLKCKFFCCCMQWRRWVTNDLREKLVEGCGIFWLGARELPARFGLYVSGLSNEISFEVVAGSPIVC